MDGHAAKRRKVENTKVIPLIWPLSAPLAWRRHFSEPIAADFVAAIRFPAAHYPEFAQGFNEHKLLPTVVQAQSLLLLYLQCVLRANPKVVCVAHGHTQANADRMAAGHAAEMRRGPVDTLFIAPLTFEQVADVMSHMKSYAAPTPPPDGQQQRQRPTPVHLGPGADYRRIRSDRLLYVASEELSHSRMDRSHYLISPDVETGIDDISEQMPAHFISICNATKVIPKWNAATQQQNVASYFTEAPDGGFNFKLDPVHEELGVRCLTSIPQVKLFQSLERTGENANMLLRFTFPNAVATDGDLRKAVARTLQMKGLEATEMGKTPTKSFIINGYTLKEPGNSAAADERLMCHDPQLNNPIEDSSTTFTLLGSELNAKITLVNYPMLGRTQTLHRSMLDESSNPEERARTFCKLYESAYRSFEAGGGAGFPAAIYDLMHEANVMSAQLDEYKVREPGKHKYVTNLWKFRGTEQPLIGFDTLGTLIVQFFHIGIRAMGLMTTQMPGWMVLCLSLLGGIVRNTNKKLRIGLLGTPESGKSHMGDKFFFCLPTALTAIDGDRSELAKVHEGPENDMRASKRDEVAERGDDEGSRKKLNSRGFRAELTGMEDGYVIKQTSLPQVQPDGSTVIQTVKEMVAQRTTEIMCLNSIMSKDNPYISRVCILRIADPSRHESLRCKQAKKKEEQEPAAIFMRMMATLQLVSCLPSHFGLDRAGTDTQLLNVFCSLLETVGGQLSPYGRELGKLESHLENITALRLAAEAARFKSCRPGSSEPLSRPQMALQCVVNNVSSPADVLAAYSSFASCGVSTKELTNALLEALVGLIEHKLAKDDDNGTMRFAGFHSTGGHYVLQQMGTGPRRAGEEMMVLMERAHSLIRAIIPTATPSKPDVKGGLEDLGQRYVNGVAALTQKPFTDPESPEERASLRWAVSKELLRQAKLGRLRALCRGIHALVARLKTKRGHVMYTEDEQRWRLPHDDFAEIAINPTKYKNWPDNEVQRIAQIILLPCDVKPGDDNAEDHMLSADKADVFFRLGESLGLFDYVTFNSSKAYILVDADQSDGRFSVNDPSMRLQPVTLQNGCIEIDIKLCKEYASSTSSRVSTLVQVAQTFQAVTLEPECFVNQHKMYLGQETLAEDGSAQIRTVPLHTPTVGQKYKTTDFMYRKSNAQCNDVLGPALDASSGAVMPGNGPTVTYKHGSNLYEKLLTSHAEKNRLPAAYITRWHIPGWTPT